MKSRANATEFNRLRAALLLRNMTLDEWALSEGYSPNTVRTIARRCLDREYKHTGMRTDEILCKLKSIITSIPAEASNGA